MSEESPPEIEAPAVGASVVRYREGWGAIAGSLALLAFPGLFLWYILDPSIRAESPDWTDLTEAWIYFIIIGIIVIPMALIMLFMGTWAVFQLKKVYVDNSGIWWDSGTRFAVIRWSELRGLRARKAVTTVSLVDNKRRGPTRRGIELIPSGPQFAERRPKWIRVDYGTQPEQSDWDMVNFLFGTPYMWVQRRIVEKIREYRPDLVL